MAIKRQLHTSFNKRLHSGKAIIVTGSRQVGKTTLINDVLNDLKEPYLFLNADDPAVRTMLQDANTEQLRQLIGEYKFVFIDEAQRIISIGLTAKIITDQFKDCQLILSGSSAFDLNTSVQETLTGRKWTYEMFPISWQEWQDHVGYLKAEQDLENRMIFGFYPDVLNHPTEQAEILTELINSYLYKDLLQYAGIRKPDVVQKLVRALAFQVGQEVVYSEISKLIGVDAKTVSQYIDVLEKAYVVFRLPSFSRNLRNEIKTNQKVYFYDNGVRNAVMGAYQPISQRQDTGALWENFLVSERIKQLSYSKSLAQTYFWRTKQQQEVDFVEVESDAIRGYEFKWNTKKTVRLPKTFTETYQASSALVHRGNFREFVMIK